jgi:crotonobetainyl-CoA:carnitine CoA-transferase CaiB-like acyl-CoA transferase
MAEQESLPLEGIRVLEFCHTVMGPAAGVLLGDLGAEIIKVEAAPLGDTTRRMRGFANGFFYAFNRNKRSLAVNLKSIDGQNIIHRLVPTIDVVIENFGPGTMDRLGCGYEALSKLHPKLIYAEMKGFLSGPYEDRLALDEVVQYMTGLAYMTGPPGRPLRAGASVIDVMGGMFAVIAVQAALRDRERTGRGNLVKSALFESAAFLMTQHMSNQVITGVAPPPMADKEKRTGAWPVYQTFDTSDGKQIFIGLTTDNHWRRFWSHFGRLDIVENELYATNALRVKNKKALTPIVAKLVSKETLLHMIEVCENIKVPFSPVAIPGDLFEDPHLNKGGHMLDIEFPGNKHGRMPALPIEMDGHHFGVRRQAPDVGEHTKEILKDLGMSKSEIESLYAREVVVWPTSDNVKKGE